MSKAVSFFVVVKGSSYCPICSDLLLMRSNRKRTLIDIYGDKAIFIIRRLFCCNCKRIHHEVPDCIVPYKRHCADTIENIIGGRLRAACDERTTPRIKAWWAAVRTYFMNILQSLTKKHGARYQDPPAFREIVRAVVNSNNWIHAHLICTRSVMLSGPRL